MPVTFLQQIRFALYRFHSLLLTASQLISFPSGTKTLQFPEFNIVSDCSESTKTYSGTSGSMAACASPENFVACHALHLQLSLVIPLMGSVDVCYLCKITDEYEVVFFTRKSNPSLKRLCILSCILIFNDKYDMDPSGFEPEAPYLQGRCSMFQQVHCLHMCFQTELRAQHV